MKYIVRSLIEADVANYWDMHNTGYLDNQTIGSLCEDMLKHKHQVLEHKIERLDKRIEELEEKRKILREAEDSAQEDVWDLFNIYIVNKWGQH